MWDWIFFNLGLPLVVLILATLTTFIDRRRRQHPISDIINVSQLPYLSAITIAVLIGEISIKKDLPNSNLVVWGTRLLYIWGMLSIGVHVAQSQLFDRNDLATVKSAIISVMIFVLAVLVTLAIRTELNLF